MTGEPGESWRSFAAGLTEATVRDLGTSGGDSTALIAIADGRAVGWSGAAEAFHPVVLDLATGAFTDVALEPGDDLGMLMDADDGWAVGWSYRREGGEDTSIAWNLATGERRVIGKGLITATGGGWVVGVSPDGNFSATEIATGRIGRSRPDAGRDEPRAHGVRRPLAGRQLRRARPGHDPGRARPRGCVALRGEPRHRCTCRHPREPRPAWPVTPTLRRYASGDWPASATGFWGEGP